MLIDCPTLPAKEFKVQHEEKIRELQQRFARDGDKWATNCRPVIVNGVRYVSASHAASTLNICEATIRKAAHRGYGTSGKANPIHFTASWAEREPVRPVAAAPEHSRSSARVGVNRNRLVGGSGGCDNGAKEENHS